MLGTGVRTHLVTLHHALPLVLRGRTSDDPGLVVGLTDGTAEAHAGRRHGVGFHHDLVKASVGRVVIGLAAELADHTLAAVGVTPGWLRSEAMLDHFGVTEETWRDACERVPEFAISESPTYVARGVAAMAVAGDARAGDVVSARQLADAYDVTDADGSRPDCWGHLARFVGATATRPASPRSGSTGERRGRHLRRLRRPPGRGARRARRGRR